MACNCDRRFPMHPHPSHPVPHPSAPVPPCHGGPFHTSQTPTFIPRCTIPCGRPMFIPNQPPPHHHHGCCEVPPPPQRGPWEYTPSYLYPDRHTPCECCGMMNPHHMIIPIQPMPMHFHAPRYECMPKQGCMPSPCRNLYPVPPFIPVR